MALGWNKQQAAGVATNQGEVAVPSQKDAHIQKVVPSKEARDKVFIFPWSSRTGCVTAACTLASHSTFRSKAKQEYCREEHLLENSTGQTAALPSPQRLRSPVAFDTVCSTN